MKNGTDDAPRGAYHKVAQDQAQEEWQCLPVHPAPPVWGGGALSLREWFYRFGRTAFCRPFTFVSIYR